MDSGTLEPLVSAATLESQRFWSPTREILVLYFSNLEKLLFAEAIDVVKSLTVRDHNICAFSLSLHIF
jgi:hypothetical protein